MKNLRRLLVIVAVLLATQVNVFAANIVVGGDCTLSAAIASANRDEAVGGCAAGEGADIITLSQDITLDAPLLPISTEIEIDGNGVSISGNGAHRIFLVEETGILTIRDLTLAEGSTTSRGGAIYNIGILKVFDSSFLTSAAGRFGGAIANWGDAEVMDSSFLGNVSRFGGGIYNRAGKTLVIQGGSFRENAAQADESLTGIESNPMTNLFGGAVYNQGDATISDSIFVSNRSSADGGALWNIGSAKISESLFRGNLAVNDGGAIANSGDLTIESSAFSQNQANGNFGGAIANWGSARITATEFTSNELDTAAGAAIANWGEAEIEGSHFIANVTASQGGAIFTVGNADIKDSTFRDNASAHGGAIINQEGGTATITDSKFTGNATSNRGGAIYSAVDGDVKLENSRFSVNVADDGGGALYSDGAVEISGSQFRDNSAATHGGAVVSGSELNISDSLFRDNRSEDGGGIRHLGSGLTVDDATTAKFRNNLGGDCVGPACMGVDIVLTESCTLADAIGAANNDSPYGGCPAGEGADTIGLQADITLSRALPEITSEIIIEGAGLSIDAADSFRIFHVAENGDLTVRQLTLVNGRASGPGEKDGWGGAILNESSLTAENSVFLNSFADHGGAILTDKNATSVIRDSQFSGNSAKGNGGAIYNEAEGTSTVEGSVFEGNFVKNSGGGIYNAGVASVRESDFNANEAENGGGGGIFNMGEKADITIDRSDFSGNTAAEGQGDAIGNQNDGRLRQTESTFSGGQVDGYCVGAGCVPVDIMTSDTCSLADAITAANTDSAVGGCPAGDGADVIGLSMDLVLEAELPPINSPITIEGEGRTIDGAKSWRIFTVKQDAELNVNWLTMTNGDASDAEQGPGWGGAILNLGTLAVARGVFSDNSAEYGGAIDNEDGGSSVIVRSEFSGNKADIAGGAIHNEDSDTSLRVAEDTVFSGNSSRDGGALHNIGIASVSGSRFEGNSAEETGGAIHNEGATSQLSVSDSGFENNTAVEGGALYDAAGTLTENDNRFSGNTGGDCIGPSCVPGDIVASSLCSIADAITAANTDTATGGCPAGSDADSIGLSADITLTAALPPITSEITILGNDKTINGAETFRIFIVGGQEGVLNVNNLTMANGAASGKSGPSAWGGAILNYGKLTVNDSKFENNTARFGGAIEIEEGTVVIKDSKFIANTAKLPEDAEDGEGRAEGGAIYSEAAASLTVLDSEFVRNKAKDGGAITSSGVASVSDSEFKDNSAEAGGGAIAGIGAAAQLTITRNTFSGNTAPQGGDIFNGAGALERSDNTPAGGAGLDCVGPGCSDGLVVNASCSLADAISAANTDSAVGGCPAGDGADVITMAMDVTLSAALPNIESEISIKGKDHTVSGNNQFRIFFVEESGNLSISDLTLTQGRAHETDCTGARNRNGGAICNQGSLTVAGSAFIENSAKYGGAIYNLSGGTATITDSDFRGNQADSNGGAIYKVSRSVITVSGNSFSNNSPNNCTGVSC